MVNQGASGALPGRLALLLSIVPALLVSCGLAVDRANVKALSRDAKVLLEAHHVAYMGLACRMEGAGRCGSCSTILAAPEAAKLVAALGLRPSSDGASSDGASSDGASSGGAPGESSPSACTASPALHARSGLQVLRVDGSPEALRLQGGGAFTHLVMYIDEATGEACLHVCYA